MDGLNGNYDDAMNASNIIAREIIPTPVRIATTIGCSSEKIANIPMNICIETAKLPIIATFLAAGKFRIEYSAVAYTETAVRIAIIL